METITSQVNLPEIIKNYLTRAQQSILGVVITSSNVHQKVMPSHMYIALKVGCCRRTVLRGLKRLKELGLLSWIKRGYKKTNWYRLCSDFFDTNIRQALSHFIPQCAYSPKAIYKALKKNVTLCYPLVFKSLVLDSNVSNDINILTRDRVISEEKSASLKRQQERAEKERRFFEKLEEERRLKREAIQEEENQEFMSIIDMALSLGTSLLRRE